MTVFEKAGKQNTEKTLEIAAARAAQRNAPLVVASTAGETAVSAVHAAKRAGVLSKLVIVGSVPDKGVQKMSCEAQALLRENGVPLVLSSHVLSGAERGLSTKMGGVYPVEIIAHTLRMLSQGVKVCVECGVMALDCGAIPFGEAIIAVGGTGHGADTCCVLTPAGANAILECKIHEILCKPY
jgi:hypothetical protein